MKKHISIALVVVLGLSVIVTSQADHCDAVETVNVGTTPEYYVFVGWSGSMKQGNAGLRAMNKACEDKYGQGARMCTSEDINKSWKIPAGTKVGWVNPSNITLGQFQSGDQWAIDGPSGMRRTSTNLDSFLAEERLSCRKWSTSNINCQGLTWHCGWENGTFRYMDCYYALPVACCNR